MEPNDTQDEATTRKAKPESYFVGRLWAQMIHRRQFREGDRKLRATKAYIAFIARESHKFKAHASKGGVLVDSEAILDAIEYLIVPWSLARGPKRWWLWLRWQLSVRPEMRDRGGKRNAQSFVKCPPQ